MDVIYLEMRWSDSNNRATLPGEGMDRRGLVWSRWFPQLLRRQTPS